MHKTEKNVEAVKLDWANQIRCRCKSALQCAGLAGPVQFEPEAAPLFITGIADGAALRLRGSIFFQLWLYELVRSLRL